MEATKDSSLPFHELLRQVPGSEGVRKSGTQSKKSWNRKIMTAARYSAGVAMTFL
jgi:hypothetical protein